MSVPTGRRFASGAWLRCVHARPRATTTLLAFPHAGGSAGFFHSWGALLPAHVELTALQYPGRLDRLHEPCLDDIHRLADAIGEVVRARVWPPGRRLALLGHSMGAVVAFETALRLQAHGTVPVAVFLSSHPAPGRPLRNVLTEFSDEALLGELRRLGGTPSALTDGSQLNSVIFAALRGDFRAVARYRPSPGRLSCPIVAMVGDADPDVGPDDMRGWADRTSGSSSVHVFPGDHFYLRQQRDAVLRVAAEHLGERPGAALDPAGQGGE